MVQTKLGFFLGEEDTPYQGEDYISHRNLKEKTIRKKRFQIEIANRCLHKNTAVILPTGLGKTIIAFLVIAEILPRRVLFLAPTKPLAVQHYESCKKFLNLDEKKIALMTGSISPKKRAVSFNDSIVIVSTPQTIANDMKKGLYSLDQIALVIFDEMHKAVENYAYVYIAEKFNGLILGLTASPGAGKKKVGQIFENLKIKNVESRLHSDEDVREHIKGIKIEWVKVAMDDELRKIQKPIKDIFLERLERLNKVGILTYKKPNYISKKDILSARLSIQKRFGRSPYAFPSMINQAVLMQAYHCLELIETQGAASFLQYMDKFKDKEKLSKSEALFYKDNRVQKAIALASSSRRSHPKLGALKTIVKEQFKENKDALLIIFTQYRGTIESIEQTLGQINSVRYARFIGQASRNRERGMSQKEQKEIIERLRNHELNVLIATSVAEEGIDIPDVSMVIFYEPIPSEIRGIQRKGRTGRSSVGKVTILITEGTRDEAYLYAEIGRERKMHSLIKSIRG